MTATVTVMTVPIVIVEIVITVISLLLYSRHRKNAKISDAKTNGKKAQEPMLIQFSQQA